MRRHSRFARALLSRRASFPTFALMCGAVSTGACAPSRTSCRQTVASRSSSSPSSCSTPRVQGSQEGLARAIKNSAKERFSLTSLFFLGSLEFPTQLFYSRLYYNTILFFGIRYYTLVYFPLYNNTELYASL